MQRAKMTMRTNIRKSSRTQPPGSALARQKALLMALFVLLLTPRGTADSRIAFCDLLHDPQAFNGKEVTVRATYRYGYEWSQLYCLDCLDKGRAWLSIPADVDEKTIKALKHAPKWAGTVNVTVHGVFMSGGTFGHLNGYRYQFVADSVTDVAIIVKGMKSLKEEEAAEKRWACGGTNPK